jgi:signal transduction histidine kinase
MIQVRHIVFLLLFALANLAQAQEKGFLRGNVADGEIGGGMIGATVVLADQPGVGTVTDFDGNYSLPLAPGTYDIKISFNLTRQQVFADKERIKQVLVNLVSNAIKFCSSSIKVE